MSEFTLNLKRLIAKGNLENTISQLQDSASETPLLNNVILQSSRLSNLSKEIHEGVIRLEDIQIERNKITKAVLSLIDEIDYEIKNNYKIKEEVDRFLISHKKLKEDERKMTLEEKKARFQHFDSYDDFINSKPPEERFSLQKLNSEVYLKDFGLSIKDLKLKLKALNYFDGELDNDFTRELANSLEMFQHDNSMRHIDGFFGELTYDMIALRLKEMN
ncbi:MAG: peptidoglycan-binding protein [Saprospiraceae bacterium]